MENISSHFKIGEIVIEYEVQENGCWVCTSHRLNNGYPQVFPNRHTMSAHRLVYMKLILKVDELDRFVLVRHKCDNRACVNPNHLELGSYLDNNRDRVDRGRHSSLNGEKSSLSKLTNEDAELIRKLYNSGLKTIRELSEIFKVSIDTIYLIIKNKRYKS